MVMQRLAKVRCPTTPCLNNQILTFLVAAEFKLDCFSTIADQQFCPRSSGAANGNSSPHDTFFPGIRFHYSSTSDGATAAESL